MVNDGKTKIKAVLLDLGQVLVKFDAGLLGKGYARYAKVFDEDMMTEYLLDSDNVNRYMEGKLTSSQFYMRTCKFFRLRIKYNEFYSIWNSIFYPYPEMEDIVRRIREKYPDIKLVLVSNTNETHYDFIKQEYEVLGLLDHCVVSHESGSIKPHPGIYNEALKAAGVISKEAFYTDDRPDLVDAARVMGIRAYLFTGHEKFRKDLAKCGVEV